MTPYFRSNRVRVLVLMLALVVAVTGLASIYFKVPQTIRYRLSGPEKVGDAQLDPPGAFQWPQLSYDSAIAHCDFCGRVRSSTLNRKVQFGLLVEDVNLTNPFSSNVANRPHSPADVPLPRLVWVVEWQDDCWRAPPPGMRQCTTYDIIDDQIGWELETAQFWSR